MKWMLVCAILWAILIGLTYRGELIGLSHKTKEAASLSLDKPGGSTVPVRKGRSERVS